MIIKTMIATYNFDFSITSPTITNYSFLLNCLTSKTIIQIKVCIKLLPATYVYYPTQGEVVRSLIKIKSNITIRFNYFYYIYIYIWVVRRGSINYFTLVYRHTSTFESHRNFFWIYIFLSSYKKNIEHAAKDCVWRL